MQQYKLEPKRLRMVHPDPDSSARLVLVEGRKNGRPGLKVESTLILSEVGGLFAGGASAIFDTKK
jgi:tRNA1Val (adenine37-N6)-methyltransferase